MTAVTAAPSRANSAARVAVTAMAATSIEWYDFFIFGTAAALVFPKLFFPATLSPTVAVLASFSTFAVGFIARPLGGALFGHFGDRFGRKRAFVAALMVMGGATAIIGLLPTYATLGPAAPLLLVVLRFTQGLAIGGQWGGAALIAIENAPPGRRGLYGSFPQLGVPMAVLLANLVFLFMARTVAPSAFMVWGWRIPFLLSLLLVMLGLYVQARLEETSKFRALVEDPSTRAARSQLPLLDLFKKYPKEILLAAGAMLGPNGCFYLAVTYVISYSTTTIHMERSAVLWAILLGNLISAPVLPLTGALSDRFGRRRIVMLGSLLTGIWAFALWRLVDIGQFLPLALGVAGALGMLNFGFGPQPALFAELFPTDLRYSGVSMGYQLGGILGGAFAPIIAAALIARFHSSVAISVYMSALSAASLISVFLLSDPNSPRRPTAVEHGTLSGEDRRFM